MRYVLVAIVALALASPAMAKTYKDTDGGIIEVTGGIQQTNKQGKALGPWKALPDSAIESVKDPKGNPATPLGPAGKVPVARLAAALSSGCATVYGQVTKYDPFFWPIKVLLYWFKHSAHFCWSYPKVTGVNRSTDGKGANGWSYDGVVASSVGTFYTWCCGEPHSGHTRMFRGGFHIQAGPVQQTAYPGITLNLRGNGSATYSVS